MEFGVFFSQKRVFSLLLNKDSIELKERSHLVQSTLLEKIHDHELETKLITIIRTGLLLRLNFQDHCRLYFSKLKFFFLLFKSRVINVSVYIKKWEFERERKGKREGEKGGERSRKGESGIMVGKIIIMNLFTFFSLNFLSEWRFLS